MRLWICWLLSGLALGPASAQENAPDAAPDAFWAPDLLKPIELPAHGRLIELILQADTGPNAFTTDGCSGGMSAGWALVSEDLPALPQRADGLPPWQECCITHDRAYHSAGGARSATESYAARLRADQALRACVAQTGTRLHGAETSADGQAAQLYGLLAQSMFAAVRLGGGPCTGLPWRWGYGFAPC